MLMEHGIMKAVDESQIGKTAAELRPLDPITTRVWPSGQTYVCDDEFRQLLSVREETLSETHLYPKSRSESCINSRQAF